MIISLEVDHSGLVLWLNNVRTWDQLFSDLLGDVKMAAVTLSLIFLHGKPKQKEGSFSCIHLQLCRSANKQLYRCHWVEFGEMHISKLTMLMENGLLWLV